MVLNPQACFGAGAFASCFQISRNMRKMKSKVARVSALGGSVLCAALKTMNVRIRRFHLDERELITGCKSIVCLSTVTCACTNVI